MLVASTPRVAAADAPLRLRYTAPAKCPTTEDVTRAVRKEAGREAFSSAAPAAVSLTISEETPGLRADIVFFDEIGTLVAQRELVSARADCRELVFGFALLVALHLERSAALPARKDAAPPVVRRPPPATPRPRHVDAKPETTAQPPPEEDVSEPPPEAPAPAVVAHVETPTPPPAPARIWRPQVGLDLLAEAGMSPDLLFGPRLSAGLRAGRFAVMSSAAWLAHAGGDTGTTPHQTRALVLDAAACHTPWPLWHLAGCLGGALGLVQAEGRGLDVPRTDRALSARLNADVRLTLPLTAPWAVTFMVGPAVNPWPWRFEVDGMPVYRAPALAWHASVGVVWAPR